MNKLTWTNESWEDYLYWQTQDRKTLKKINLLIKDILRSPFERNWKARATKREFKWILE